MPTNGVPFHELRRIHARALGQLDDVVRVALGTPLGVPTPCAGWTLGDLLAHEMGQVTGFARAIAARSGPTLRDFAPVAPTPAAWATAVAMLHASVAAAAEDDPVHLPELAPRRTFTAERATAFRALDSVVHTWDVCRAMGRDHRPGAGLLEWVVTEAAEVPLVARGPLLGFDEPVARSDDHDDDPWGAALRHLGRQPGWGPRR